MAFHNALCTLVLLIWPIAAGAQQLPYSTIAVPISISVGDVQDIANRALPMELHSNSYRRTCIEPEQACTKVPEFRGFQVTMKNRCVEVTPRIECSIDELVRREGQMSVSGSASTLTVRQDIYGSATVRGLGEIGRHIRQTIRTRAEVIASANIGVASNWTPILQPNISYRWIDRPEFRLFNLFPITLGTTLAPPLDSAMRDFETNTVPQMLASVDLRGETKRMWSAIQAPIPFNLPGNRKGYLHLRPTHAGLDGPRFDRGRLTATLNLRLRTWTTDTREGPSKTLLPNLSSVTPDGVSLIVPVRLSTETLNAMIAETLPRTEEIERPVRSTFRISDTEIFIDEDKLVFDARVEGSASHLGRLPERLRVTALPTIDRTNKVIVFEIIDISASGGVLTAFLKNAALAAFRPFFEDTLRVSFAENLDKIEKSLNAALNRPLGAGLRLSGSGTLKVQNLRLLSSSDMIELQLASTGTVRITGFDPLK